MEQAKSDLLEALSACNTSNQWSMLDAVAKKVSSLMLDASLALPEADFRCCFHKQVNKKTEKGGTTPFEKPFNTQLLSYFHAFKKVSKKTGKEVTPRELENLMLELGPEVLRCPLIPSQ